MPARVLQSLRIPRPRPRPPQQSRLVDRQIRRRNVPPRPRPGIRPPMGHPHRPLARPRQIRAPVADLPRLESRSPSRRDDRHRRPLDRRSPARHPSTSDVGTPPRLRHLRSPLRVAGRDLRHCLPREPPDEGDRLDRQPRTGDAARRSHPRAPSIPFSRPQPALHRELHPDAVFLPGRRRFPRHGSVHVAWTNLVPAPWRTANRSQQCTIC